MALLRSIATVGGWTLMSRVLGLARDILIAQVLGTGPVADAFFVAFRFPNLFRRLFAEGAFNAAFVPMFARKLEEGGVAQARCFAEQVLAFMVAALLGFTVLAQITMPWLMHAIAPGFRDDPVQFDLAVQFTQITFPYLLFMSLTALQGGVLNTLHRFAHAAAAPILLNVIAIIALAFVAPLTGLPGHTLAWAVAAAGIGQFLWLVIACHRAGMGLRLPLPRLTPKLRRLFRLMGPGILGAGVMQANLLVGTMIATIQNGAVSYLYYADRLYQLPLSMIGVAIGVVLLPELTRNLRAGRPAQAMATLNRSLELALLLTLPAAAALIAVPQPIIALIYERGAFGPAATHATALALAAFAAGLPAYVLIKALAPGFYAREDTVTPFYIAVADVAVNIALSLLLFQWLAYLGIAIATATAAWIDAGLLAFVLRRRGHLVIDDRLARRVPRILLSAVAMALGVWALARFLSPVLAAGAAWEILGVLALVLAGVMLFAASSLLTGAASLSEFRELLRRRQPAG